METKKDINQVFDIPFAKRQNLKSPNTKFFNKLFLFTPVILIFFFIIGIISKQDFVLFKSLRIKSSTEKIFDERILGHLPYKEISKEKLVFIEPDIKVHVDMSKSLLKMRDDAKRDGIFLVFLSGFRSISLQKDIFYSLKSIRNQVASERARVSAPPGYSEHSTGFAIDIGDATDRGTDFEVKFEDTDAFRWLKKNAAKYHFKLSFTKNNKYIDYEPWHWRYEGSIEALKIFEASNRR